MSLVPGARLGPYEIASPLGAGGMGEVYRAHDTKLGRDVALKILPDAFATDPERLARFEREAQLLAALNHPHVATLHGLEQADGRPFLVMELVEGQTLAQRLAEGPLPMDEALAIARQVADALVTAHDKGIIHRDLKPSNIAMTADGRVKVLDFGLAKALESSDASGASRPDVSASPTLSLAATHAGVILGTAAYMAPEQAKGRPADRRSDLWAFGCVLYEMLAGRPAFDGDDITDILGAVVRLDPDWTAVPSSVPLPVRTLLRTCLEKDRRKRTVEAATALFVLDNASTLIERVIEAPPPASGARWWQRVIPTVAAVLVTAAIAGAAAWMTRPPAPLAVRSTIVTEGAMALTMQGLDRDIAITPDGSQVVYRGANQLFVRSLQQLEPRALTGVGTPRGTATSPDGQWVAYFDGNAPMKKVAITGGPPVTVVANDGNGPRGLTWGSDGTIVFATNEAATGLQRVASGGGDVTVLTKPDTQRGEGDHFWPEFLPDARGVLFTIMPPGGDLQNTQIAVLDLRSGQYKVVMRGGSHAHYTPSGHLVYGVEGTLRAVPFDLDRLEVTGTAAPVLEGVVTTGQGAADFTVAANGTLVYVPGTSLAGAQRTLTWVDRSGREEPIADAPVRAYQYPRISPDGTRVALDIRDQDSDIWIWDFGRRTLTRLTLESSPDQYPAWTPDSRRVVFASQRAGAFNLFWQAADGTGSAEQLTTGALARQPYSTVSDGSAVVIRENNVKTQIDLMLVPLKPGGTPTPLVQTAFFEANGEVSPDRRWLAYQSNDSGQLQIYVQTFPDGSGGRWQVSTAGGRTPVWSRKGDELFYRAPDGGVMAVKVEAGASWRTTAPVRVIQGTYFDTPGINGRAFDVSPDGRRFLMIKQSGAEEGQSRNLVLVQHWFEELKRIVPTD